MMFMPPKRKDDRPYLYRHYLEVRKSHRTKNDHGEAIWTKLEKLDVIQLQLKEVHAKVASIEDSVSRLDSEIHVLKTRTTKLEKNEEELEEGFQYNKDDVRDLQHDNKKLEHEVCDF